MSILGLSLTVPIPAVSLLCNSTLHIRNSYTLKFINEKKLNLLVLLENNKISLLLKLKHFFFLAVFSIICVCACVYHECVLHVCLHIAFVCVCTPI